MARTVTKSAVQVDSTTRIPEIIGAAFRQAMSGRPGTVYVDLPGDVLSSAVDEQDVRYDGFEEGSPPRSLALGDQVAVQKAAELLLRAERPIMILGKGVRWADATEGLRAFVESLERPYLTSPMGSGLHP